MTFSGLPENLFIFPISRSTHQPAIPQSLPEVPTEAGETAEETELEKIADAEVGNSAEEVAQTQRDLSHVEHIERVSDDLSSITFPCEPDNYMQKSSEIVRSVYFYGFIILLGEPSWEV